MFFDDWATIGRTILIGVLAYAGLVLFLRVSGKRTLSKMNAFDLVVTVALGSTLATILLSKDVALAEGLTAFFILIALQYFIAFFSVRSGRVSNMIKSNPQFLYREGCYFYDVMKRKRVLKVEILQAARSNGIRSMGQVEAVVLETDGSISVIQKTDQAGESTLENVKDRKG
ncbi:DUF421 domain-containing protein [Cytobacillus gottheilii]|uniref:DUF421 domain-containing protein n=1 Tax=Cytobacillus gottheilii TaxID=859144 RepID=UPI0009BBB459|nr:YetF domain-containing protein [Cytobacillus gottheilii]